MPSGSPVSEIVEPSQTGELLEAVATGLALTSTLVETGSLEHEPSETVR